MFYRKEWIYRNFNTIYSKNSIDSMKYYSIFFDRKAKKNNNNFRGINTENINSTKNYPVEFAKTDFNAIYILRFNSCISIFNVFQKNLYFQY